MSEYRQRIADDVLDRRLAGTGAVLVRGPKWCGKTTTCVRHAKSVLYMADPDAHDQNLRMAKLNISSLLKGDNPRLIDEWQEAPKFWDAIRAKVDGASDVGQYILTGSAVPPDTDEIVHSGTGRIASMKMRPMSLWESGESSGGVSIGALLDGVAFETAESRRLTLDEMAYVVCRGGWPMAVDQRGDIALDRAFDYYEAVVNADISRVDHVPRDPERVMRLMRSYARLQGTQSNLTAIRKDLTEHESHGLGEDTIDSYLKALRKIFVVDDVKAWSPSLRAKSIVRTSDTRYFIDPSIATAALSIGPGDLMGDLRSFGYFFETLAMRDLQAYAEAHFGGVHHYLDRNGLECDAVIHARNGHYGLVEVKLGGDDLIAEGAATLNKLAKILDPDKMRLPSFKMVLTAVGDFAYRREEDGVIVCPLSALKP